MAIIPEREPYIQALNPAWYQPYVEAVDMLRLDVMHPVVSGNKWYKLKYNLEEALQQNSDCILTFGGSYSNHLIAAAAAAKHYNIQSIGIVRGINKHNVKLTPTLQDCHNYGMVFFHASREEYRSKSVEDFIFDLNLQSKNVFVIPEGGANALGRKGSEEIAEYIPDKYTHVCLSLGSGTTFVGIRNALPANQYVFGYVPMKKGIYLIDEVSMHIDSDKQNYTALFDKWHCGGFGKWNNELVDFMNSFYEFNQIPLDIVYTGKMMMGLHEQLHSAYFPKNARILCIHTGGLQGNSSVQECLRY